MIDLKSLTHKEPVRLDEHDLIQHGAYFITVYAFNHYMLFVSAEREECDGFIHPCLTSVGKIIDYEIQMLSRVVDGILVDNYVIMPNHVHMILRIINHEQQNGEEAARQAVGKLKRTVSLKAGFSAWHKSFQVHAIQDEEEYWIISNYIDVDPARG